MPDLVRGSPAPQIVCSPSTKSTAWLGVGTSNGSHRNYKSHNTLSTLNINTEVQLQQRSLKWKMKLIFF